MKRLMWLFSLVVIACTSMTSYAIIGPKDTVIKPDKPIDNGLVLIPEDLFPQGNGKPIPIYIPNCDDNGSNANFSDWKTIKEIIGNKIKFSEAKFLENLAKFDAPHNPDIPDLKRTIKKGPESPFEMALTLIQAFVFALEKSGFRITIQENDKGNFRAVIEIYSDATDVLRRNANGVISSPDFSYPPTEYLGFSEYLIEKFGLPKSKDPYQAFWYIDKNHKKDPYIAYFAIRPEINAICVAPKIYSGDRFEIRKLTNPFKPGALVLEFSGGEYVGLWSYIESTQAPETLKILELLPVTITSSQDGQGTSIAVIVDHSGSMSGEKLAKAKQAADSFYATLTPFDQSCLVTFSSKASTQIGLLSATLENKAKLRTYISGVQSVGSTNVGAGLHNGLVELEKSINTTQRSTLLLSDGMHNTGDLWSHVDAYATKGWSIYTVAYGRDADQKTLAEIAQRTGGTFFPAAPPNLAQVYQRISAQAHNRSVLFAYNDTISQGKTLSYDVSIDKDITSANFFADWQGSTVEMRLRTPDGQEINQDNVRNFSDVHYQTGDTFTYYQVNNPKVGKWQAKLLGTDINQAKEQVNFTVSGKSPLLANTFGFQPDYRKGEVIQITAKVVGLFSDTPEVLKDAKVTCEVTKPDPNIKKMLERRVIDLGSILINALTKKKTLSLYDDGLHNDGGAGDGVYGADYKEADANGAYLIKVRCEAKTPDGQKITRTLRESIQVGPIENNAVTLADFLGL